MINISLIGMPASGKSTVGVILAKTLGMDFVDTDLIIQKSEGRVLQDIIDNDGIDKFLKCEENALLSLKIDNTVIATGGSAVLCEEGMKYLKSISKIVYIEVECNELEKRLSNIQTRGIACKKGDTPIDIFNKRKHLYEKYSDLTIKSKSNNVELTIQDIINLL